MNQVKYIVNKQEGIIVCIGTGCKYDCFRNLNKISNKLLIDTKHFEQLILPDQFKAIVKLHPDDEWNEEIGKQIARKKMLSKYRNSKVKRFNGFVSFINAYKLSIMDLIRNNID